MLRTLIIASSMPANFIQTRDVLIFLRPTTHERERKNVRNSRNDWALSSVCCLHIKLLSISRLISIIHLYFHLHSIQTFWVINFLSAWFWWNDNLNSQKQHKIRSNSNLVTKNETSRLNMDNVSADESSARHVFRNSFFDSHYLIINFALDNTKYLSLIQSVSCRVQSHKCWGMKNMCLNWLQFEMT